MSLWPQQGTTAATRVLPRKTVVELVLEWVGLGFTPQKIAKVLLPLETL